MSKNGLILLTPTSIAYTGTSATISANGSVTFSACSVLSLNGVFSADYDNYMIVMRLAVAASSSDAVFYRLRTSGSDASGTDYTYQSLTGNGTSIGAVRTTQNSGYMTVGGLNSRPCGSVMNVYGPYLAQPTATRSTNMAVASLGPVFWDLANTHSVASAYDGITIFPAAVTFAGRIAVYGMRK